MCTVTYVPLSQSGWLLTSNRDESPLRDTQPPAVHMDDNIKLLYPRDALAGGTWIAVSTEGRLGCVLNGAFQPHARHLPYRRSRGLILLDLFGYSDVKDFFENYLLDNIEPFTLVVIDGLHLFDFRWDGVNRHLTELDATYPHLWASATLYNQEYQEKRQLWFQDWMVHHPERARENLMDFHLHAGEGNIMNDLVMNRLNMVRTVSIASVKNDGLAIDMNYYDVISSKNYSASF